MKTTTGWLASCVEPNANLESTEAADTTRALNAYQDARDAYDRMGGERFVDEAGAMLASMGLEGKDGQQVGSLSGGEQNVLSLTRALLSKPDLLLLDEPGNHLDFHGMAWLEDFLLRFRGAVLVVSHNRYLLDRVASGILELEHGRVTRYEGNYSAYRAQRLRNLLSQQSDYVANQKRLARLEELVRRFEQIARANSDPAWGRRLRARRSQLERERRQAVEKPDLDTSAIRTHFESAPTRANIAVQVRGYTRGYGRRPPVRGRGDGGERWRDGRAGRRQRQRQEHAASGHRRTRRVGLRAHPSRSQHEDRVLGAAAGDAGRHADRGAAAARGGADEQPDGVRAVERAAVRPGRHGQGWLETCPAASEIVFRSLG